MRHHHAPEHFLTDVPDDTTPACSGAGGAALAFWGALISTVVFLVGLAYGIGWALNSTACLGEDATSIAYGVVFWLSLAGAALFVALVGITAVLWLYWR